MTRLIGVMATLLAALGSIGAAPAEAATTIENMPLWRVQVQITTDQFEGDGTDGHPAIRFNASPTGVRTLNPQSKAAFNRKHVDTYDLRLLDSAKQIKMLRIGIASDEWCVKKVKLFLNNRVAFEDSPDNSTRRRTGCVRPGRNLEYSAFALRHNPKWLAYGTPPALPHRMTAAHLNEDAFSRCQAANGSPIGRCGVVSSVTGSAMLATPEYRWNPSVPVSVTRRNSATFRVSFGIIELDPARIDSVARKISYDVRLYVASDGRLHARSASPAGPHDGTMVTAVVAQLNKALSRMTAHPQPPNPLRFGMDASTNISWNYIPVIGQ